MVSVEWRKGRRAGGIGWRLVIHCLGILCLRKTSNDIVSVCSDVKNTFSKDGVVQNMPKERKKVEEEIADILHCTAEFCSAIMQWNVFFPSPDPVTATPIPRPQNFVPSYFGHMLRSVFRCSVPLLRGRTFNALSKEQFFIKMNGARKPTEFRVSEKKIKKHNKRGQTNINAMDGMISVSVFARKMKVCGPSEAIRRWWHGNLWSHKIQNNQTNRWRFLIFVDFPCLWEATFGFMFASIRFFMRMLPIAQCPRVSLALQILLFFEEAKKLSADAKTKANKIEKNVRMRPGAVSAYSATTTTTIILFVVAKSLFEMRLQCPSEFPLYRVRNSFELYEKCALLRSIGFCYIAADAVAAATSYHRRRS